MIKSSSLPQDFQTSAESQRLVGGIAAGVVSAILLLILVGVGVGILVFCKVKRSSLMKLNSKGADHDGLDNPVYSSKFSVDFINCMIFIIYSILTYLERCM